MHLVLTLVIHEFGSVSFTCKVHTTNYLSVQDCVVDKIQIAGIVEIQLLYTEIASILQRRSKCARLNLTTHQLYVAQLSEGQEQRRNA